MSEVENLVLEELRAIRKEIADIKDQAATRKQVAALATAVAIIAAAKGRAIERLAAMTAATLTRAGP